MSYLETESSGYMGSPLELYKFHSAIGVWCLTSGDVEVEFEGDVYMPATIKRTSIKQSEEIDNDGCTITIDALNDIIHSYMLTNTIKPLQLTIYRTHRRDGDIVPYFKGTVVNIAYENTTASLKVLLGNAALVRRCPRVSYQVPCNHVIYSHRCGINKDDYKIDAIVQKHTGFTISSPDIAAKPDGWFTWGMAEYSSGELGTQMIMITSHVKDTITMLQPFRNLIIGATVSVYAGCDRTNNHCENKFHNELRYLGWEYLPIKNPFDSGVS